MSNSIKSGALDVVMETFNPRPPVPATCGTCAHFVAVPVPIEMIGQRAGACYGVPPTPIAVMIKGQPGLSAARPTIAATERACSLWSPREDAANGS